MFRGKPAQKGKGGDKFNRQVAKHMGVFVCYAFNSPTGCSRPMSASGKGCKNNTGGEFAHVCNYRKADGDFCLEKHDRHKNH